VNQLAGAQWQAVNLAFKVSASRAANPSAFWDFSERSEGQSTC
jgi:hypothetical protein